MDKNRLISKLNKAIPGAVLETRQFGRTETPSIWVEVQTVPKIALFLASEPDVKLDWLENMSVVEFESALVLTYFLRSYSNENFLILRASVVSPSGSASVPFPSVCEAWPMAEPMEQEIEEMFGILFRSKDGPEPQANLRRLPDDWKGYPLRKGYVFPKEYLGISHTRPTSKNPQKKLSE